MKNDEKIKDLFTDLHLLEHNIRLLVNQFQESHGFFIQSIDVKRPIINEGIDFNIKVKINVEF